MPDHKYSDHDIEIAQRLTGVETRLELVTESVAEFRAANDKRLDELASLIRFYAEKPKSRSRLNGNVVGSIVAAIAAAGAAIAATKGP